MSTEGGMPGKRYHFDVEDAEPVIVPARTPSAPRPLGLRHIPSVLGNRPGSNDYRDWPSRMTSAETVAVAPVGIVTPVKSRKTQLRRKTVTK